MTRPYEVGVSPNTVSVFGGVCVTVRVTSYDDDVDVVILPLSSKPMMIWKRMKCWMLLKTETREVVEHYGLLECVMCGHNVWKSFGARGFVKMSAI